MRGDLLLSALNLEGCVAVVTGGSRGIGRAVVRRLAEAGVHVVVNYLKDEKGAAEAVGFAQELGVRAVPVRANVALLEGAEEVVRVASEKFGRLDILVCNAGIWEGAPLSEMSEELWERVVDTNLKGTWAICRAAVPLLKRSGRGRIVVISSTAGQRGEAGFSNYAASKGGQIAFTKSLAAELGPFDINVNAVAPGWVDTEMTAGALSDASYRREVERLIPLGRVAGPDEIALPVLFLCSDWARHLTGEVLNVNGGAVLCG